VYNQVSCGDTQTLCVYYLKTDIRRPCPAGEGCTVKQKGRKKGAWEYQNDSQWAQRMYEAKMAKAVVRTAVCPVCGAEFETITCTKVYCSMHCKNKVTQKRYNDRRKMRGDGDGNHLL
jgi:hypothetical protein